MGPAADRLVVYSVVEDCRTSVSVSFRSGAQNLNKSLLFVVPYLAASRLYKRIEKLLLNSISV